MPIETVAETRAAELLTALGQDFTLPVVDLSGAQFQLPSSVGNALYTEIQSPSISDLTDKTVGGVGTFDVIMTSMREHLQDQHDKGLITGDQYTKAYIEMTGGALGAGLQMVLQGDTAKWQAAMIQLQARKAEIESVTAAVQLEIVKAQLATAQRQAELANSQYVLTSMQIANADMQYKISHAQLHLVQEQAEAARAQTMDTRSDDTTYVSGTMGSQKALYNQQIVSYQRDVESKVVRMLVDGWITQKTLDEGLVAPTELQNAAINDALTILRANAGLTA